MWVNFYDQWMVRRNKDIPEDMGVGALKDVYGFMSISDVSRKNKLSTQVIY